MTPKTSTTTTQIVEYGWRQAECWHQECWYVSTLDPLGIDHAIKELPTLNQNKDVEGIVALLRRYLPTPDLVNYFDFPEMLACMRDIGLFLGSLKRHGVEPVEKIPELEPILGILGDKTNMPPRDTLFHYTIWNPSGDRLRTYTGTPDEIALIQSVQIAMRPLIESIYHLEEMHESNPLDAQFAEIAQAASEAFTGVISGIVQAKRYVSPQYFAQELRLYYDPIIWKGASYYGPGAVEMPMFLFDHLLWSSEVTDATYVEFKKAYLAFNQPFVRVMYDQFDAKPSLLQKVIKALNETKEDRNSDVYRCAKSSAKVLLGLCNMLKSFRMPHKKIAEESYKSQHHEAQRSQGSGGYSIDILSHVLALNNASIDALEEAMK